MKSKVIALVIGLFVCVTSGFATTITVTVGGDDYTLTTIEGSFDDNASLLTSQVWWQNTALAYDLITAVQGGLGYPHVGSGNLSPFIAISDTLLSDPDAVYAMMWRESDNSWLDLAMPRYEGQWLGSSTPTPMTWIVAGSASVPEAGATLGYLALAMGLLLFRRKAVRASA
jgi:hypothetical protein